VKCKNCGNILTDNATSCFLCGSTDLEKITKKDEELPSLILDNNSNLENNNVEKNNSNNSKTFLISSLVLILIFLIITIISSIMKISAIQEIFIILDLVSINLLFIVSLWKIFKKTGRKGFISLIPIYNLYCLTRIIIGNGWLFLILLIPLVNLIFLIYLGYKLAKIFGKSIWFAIGIIFLGIIFIPLLAFDDSIYLGIKKN